jgi:endonuclease/exonuclease/phosphatase family metal-dependent hydrolase
VKTNIKVVVKTKLSLRVLSFNIGFDENKEELSTFKDSWKNRKKCVIEKILSTKADIIALQGASRSQVEEIFASLSSKCETAKYDWYGLGACYYGPRREDVDTSTVDYREYDGSFLPVFYNTKKLELLKKGTFWCSSEPHVHGSKGWDSCCARQVTCVQFNAKGYKNKTFWVYNTKLDQGRFARKHSINLIRAQLDEMTTIFDEEHEKKTPYMLLGDLNVLPQSPLYNLLCHGDVTAPRKKEEQTEQDHHEDQEQEEEFQEDEEDEAPLNFFSAVSGATYLVKYDSTAPQSQVDYILVNEAWSVVSGAVLECFREDKRPASTHFPFFAVLEI